MQSAETLALITQVLAAMNAKPIPTQDRLVSFDGRLFRYHNGKVEEIKN